jgi:hypothetical protein
MISFNWHQSELIEQITKLEEKVAALLRQQERTTIALGSASPDKAPILPPYAVGVLIFCP